MTGGVAAHHATAAPLDLAKRDLALVLGGRSFTIRAYLDRADPEGPGWHTVIVEHRTPLHHDLSPTADPDACLDSAVRFVTAVTATAVADARSQVEWESEGGALTSRSAQAAKP
jgi:hypothetical protein